MIIWFPTWYPRQSVSHKQPRQVSSLEKNTKLLYLDLKEFDGISSEKNRVTLECCTNWRLSKNTGRWQKLGQMFPRLCLPKQRLLTRRCLMPLPEKGQRGGNTSGNFLWLLPRGGPRSGLSKGRWQAREVPKMTFLGGNEKIFFKKMLKHWCFCDISCSLHLLDATCHPDKRWEEEGRAKSLKFYGDVLMQNDRKRTVNSPPPFSSRHFFLICNDDIASLEPSIFFLRGWITCTQLPAEALRQHMFRVGTPVSSFKMKSRHNHPKVEELAQFSAALLYERVCIKHIYLRFGSAR